MARSIASRIWLCLAGSVIGTILALAALLVSPPANTATARVSVGESTASGNDMVAEVALASSAEVADRVRQTSDGPARDLAGDTVVRSPSGSLMLEISATAETATAAVETANAVADAYLAVRTERISARRDGAKTELTERMQALTEQIDGLVHDGQDGGARESAMRRELDALASSRASYEEPIFAGGVVSPARADDVSVSPDTGRVLIMGALAGAFLGAVLAACWHLIRREVRTATDLARLIGAPAHQIGHRGTKAVDVSVSDAIGLPALRHDRLGVVVFGSAFPDVHVDGPGGPLPCWRFVNGAIVPTGTGDMSDAVVVVPIGTPTDDVRAFRRQARHLGLRVDRAFLVPRYAAVGGGLP